MTGLSCEDRASDILWCHYGTICQSLQYPVLVSQLLCEERVISDRMLSICCAVHTNYNNLKIFASVLLKFANNVLCTNALLKDFGKLIGLFYC